jgi:hypothetical protein
MKFEESVRRQMKFLFERFGATTISNDYFPDAFGNAILIVETKTLRLRVVRDRDEVRVDVAPSGNPTDWVDSAFALAAIEAESANYSFSLDRAITSIARHLDPKFEALQDAFTPDRYPDTREKIMQIAELERAKAVGRFNAATSAK